MLNTKEKVTAENRYDNIITYDTPAYKPRKRRWGDRKEGRLLKTLPPMSYIEPFVMKTRGDAQNQFEDVIDITNIENYLQEKKSEGYTDMTLLHILIAAYVRVVAERPGLNRFIAGQRIYARNSIECEMTIKKELSLDSPDTCIKVVFDPRDSIYNVYKKFQIVAHKATSENTSFDETAKIFKKLPRFILRSAIAFLRFLDYYGLMPKSLLDVSPFHGSMIITSMGSLGIPAIYHHLYDFGTLPLFISQGSAGSGYGSPSRSPTSISHIAAVTPKLPSICIGGHDENRFEYTPPSQPPAQLPPVLLCSDGTW